MARGGQRVKKPRILIIEDEFLVSLEIAAVLTDAGFDVLEPAATVESALRAIGTEPVDAVILDRNLGGRDVHEITARLEEQKIPFAFLTGYGQETVPEQFQDVPFIAKPFNDRQLIASIQSMFQNT